MKLLSLIIVTYNSESLIVDCLDSVLKFNDIGEHLEIIIVDNASENQDSFFEMLQSRYSFDIKLISNSKNGGYGDGNNLGVKHSTAEYFIVMNPDVRIIQPIFTTLLNELKSKPNTAMIGVGFIDNSCPFYYKPEYLNLYTSLIFKIVVALGRFNMRKMHPSGSFLAFNKQIFLKVGGFDSQIFLFYEESDIANRILIQGNEIKVILDVKVYHLTHDRSFNDKLFRIEFNSLMYYMSKYKFNKSAILKRLIDIYKLKYCIAKVMRNNKKCELFHNIILIIKEKQNI